jgi:hypothetical protein
MIWHTLFVMLVFMGLPSINGGRIVHLDQRPSVLIRGGGFKGKYPVPLRHFFYRPPPDNASGAYSRSGPPAPPSVRARLGQGYGSLGCGERPRRIPREISIKVPLPDSCLYCALHR